MFTGIITATEKITGITQKNQSFFVVVALPKNWKLERGQSVSVNGICSTVRTVTKKSFEVEYMPETLEKTTAGDWQPGFAVNLEQSLTLADFVDGHLVAGHVDAVANITNLQQQGDSKVFTIAFPKEFGKFIAPKGSVALDGVSLTVVGVTQNSFTVSLVSHTLLHTNFGGKKVGDVVNLETDLLAKYIINFIKKHE